MAEIHRHTQALHKKLSGSKPLRLLYLSSFIFSIHLALMAYVNSTFLTNYIPEAMVGVIYATGSIMGIFMISKFPAILKRFGNYRTMTAVLVLSMASLFGLSNINSGFLIIPVFIFYLSFNSLVLLSLDIFVERYANPETMGKTRGMVLTFINLAWIFSPFIASRIITSGGYGSIYTIGFFIIIPIFLIITFGFKKFSDPEYIPLRIRQTFKKVFQNKNIFNICVASFILQFFYTLMVIYTPIYLSRELGYSWETLGIIFTVMLTPFVLLELPLGKLADRLLGEKEILITGFIIAGLATYAVAHIGKATPVIWAVTLFATRVGASMIEVMTESYLFKKVKNNETDIIGFFRGLAPIAVVVASLLGTIILAVFSFSVLFTILAFILFSGVIITLRIK
ncbi:MAG: MFS transporter, partial [Candidatus Paceibacterota bacterium]